MSTDEVQFYRHLGFDSNPFQSTNAEEEDRLEKYFITPPYFDSVWGNPQKPKSVVIFAPRGGGKTAQRKMIEFRSKSNEKVLCVSYSRFEFAKKIQLISLSDHLQKIIQIILIGILTKLNEDPTLIKNLDEKDKRYLKSLVNKHLTKISEQDFKNAIDSLSNYSDKAKKIWNDHLGTINVAINIILSKLGFNSVDIRRNYNVEHFEESEKYQLEKIRKITLKMNFSAIYVLIDRVDESSLTGNDASLSSKLIEPLLKDLDLLEMDGFGFKFFLWDQLQDYCRKHLRTDRISYHSLKWKDEELRLMLSRRLQAYSNNKINSFSKIVDSNLPLNVNSLIILFAQKSPRNTIRIIQDIIAEQREINSNTRLISSEAVIRGVECYSQKKVNEILDENTIRDLRKIDSLEFTINHLSNDIYKCPQDTVRSKIKKWKDLGVIENIGKEKGRKRPVNKYCIGDITIAKHILSEMALEDFITLKYKQCPYCHTTLLRDWEKENTKVCHNCSNEIYYSELRKSSRQAPISDFSRQKTLFDF